jgi:hypothetical protein
MTFPTSTAMPVEVSPPPLERYPFGLLSAASVLPITDTRWEMYGVTYYTAACGISGGLWLDECLFPLPDPTSTQAFLVTFTKATGGDVLTATLTARDVGYGTTPVTVTVGGAAKAISAVAGTQTWTVTPSGNVAVSADIAALNNYPACTTSGTYAVPATGVAGPSTALTCTVEVPAPERTKDITAGLEPVNGVPFLVYDGMACQTLGLAEVAPQAETKFGQREQYWVENTFETTVLHVGTQVIGPAGAVGLAEGIGLLEKTIADDYGGIGVIHAARELAAPLTSRYLVRRDGARMRSPMDNLYAFGAGYTTHDPTDTPAAAGQAWLYATGPVVLYRSDVQVREEFDQRKNARVAVVERSYVATADCLRAAVLVDVSEA